MKKMNFIKTKAAIFLAMSALFSTNAFAINGVVCTTGTDARASCMTREISAPGRGNALYYEVGGYSQDEKRFSAKGMLMMGAFVLHAQNASNVSIFYHRKAVYNHTIPLKGWIVKSAGNSRVDFGILKLDGPGDPRPPRR